jgi:hypothetical protein
MKVKEVLFKSLGIILLCLLVLYVDSIEFFDNWVTKVSVISITIFKSLFFVFQNFKKIQENNQEIDFYYKYLIFLGLNIIMVIISFAVDFFVLYEVSKESFIGIPLNYTLAEKGFEFIYFSILNMTNFGFGQVTPATITAKTITSMEVILSFVAIIFVLSDFMSLRDSIINRKPKK